MHFGGQSPALFSFLCMTLLLPGDVEPRTLVKSDSFIAFGKTRCCFFSYTGFRTGAQLFVARGYSAELAHYPSSRLFQFERCGPVQLLVLQPQTKQAILSAPELHLELNLDASLRCVILRTADELICTQARLESGIARESFALRSALQRYQIFYFDYSKSFKRADPKMKSSC